jgi:hypothetical protein
VFKPLDAMGFAPTGDHSGNEQRCFIPLEKHCWDIISGLFSRKFYTPWAAGRDLMSICRPSAKAAATEAMIFVV